MDKFTVDLDQVLNDFEYRELTDQCNASAKVVDNSSTSVPSQNITKHSINNVFHSLNEFLTTNINCFETPDNFNLENTGEFTRYSKDEKSINEEFKIDSNEIAQKNELITTGEDDFSLNKDDIQIKVNHFYLNTLNSYNTNSENTCSVDKDIPQFIKEGRAIDIRKIPFDNESSESSENHIDLHTELQNVVGTKFGINYQKNTKLKSEKDLLAVIGFDQALYLDDQEINKLLSELEEDDEINLITNKSESLSDNVKGYEIANSDQNVIHEGMLTNIYM